MAVAPKMLEAGRSKHQSLDLAGSVFLISSDGRILSLPIPSNSSSDPLNWSLWRRALAIAVMALFAVVSLTAVQAPSLMYHAFQGEFTDEQMRPFGTEGLSSIPTLFLGVGTMVWIPLCLAIGRRLVVLLAAANFILAVIWAALSSDYYQLLAAISLQGLSAGVAVSVLLLATIDLTFIHERPTAIAALWCLGGTASLIVLSVLPFMLDVRTYWRPFYCIWTIPSIISLVLLFLAMPETYFLRPPVAFDGRILAQSGSEKVRIYDDWEQVPGGRNLPALPEKQRLPNWLKSLRIWRKPGIDWKAMGACYLQILLCLCNPLIFWVVLLSAANFGGMMSIGIEYPIVLSQAPYKFPPSMISLVNLAAAGGSLIALPASGYAIGHVTKRLTLRNGGVRHAEVYLSAFLLPILTGAASVIVFGLAAERHWPAPWIYVSYALNSFSYVSMAVATTLWVTEAFPRWAAAALGALGVSYIVSWGLSFALPIWLRSQGLAWENIEIGIMILFLGLVAVPIAFWGQNMRQYIHGHWQAYESGALRPQ